MYDLVVEAQVAVQAARGKVYKAQIRAAASLRANDVARHLECAVLAIRAAEFAMAEAVNAALTLKEQGVFVTTDPSRAGHGETS